MNGRSSHDRCVPMRNALRLPRLAAAFLKHALPADIAAPISTELPEVIDTSYVSPGLRHRYRDLLLRTHLKTGDELLVYIFFVGELDDRSRARFHECTAELLRERCRSDGQAPPPQLLPLIYHDQQEPQEDFPESA